MTDQPMEEVSESVIPPGKTSSPISGSDDDTIPSLVLDHPFPTFQAPVHAPGDEPPPGTKRRGRPPGSKNRPKDDSTAIGRASTVLSNVPMYDSKEVQVRLAGILRGGTGLVGVIRPHFAMTVAEADAISKPLSTYLVRRAPESQAVQTFLEHYDIAAFVLATLAYAIRVIRDDIEYRKQHVKPRALPTRNQRDESPVATSGGEQQREATDGGIDTTFGGIGYGISSPIIPG